MKSATLTLLALLLFAASAYGYPVGCRSWAYVMPGGPRGNAGTAEGSLDGLDASDVAVYVHGGWCAGTSRVPGVDGWTSPAGFYASDLRAPLTVGQSKSLDIYVWAVAGTSGTASPQFSFAEGAPYDPNVLISAQCIHVPAGVDGGPVVGTTWTEPYVWIPLPYYATDDPTTSYGFRVTVTMIPEPSAAVSLAGMILCFLGTRLRRRG